MGWPPLRGATQGIYFSEKLGDTVVRSLREWVIKLCALSGTLMALAHWVSYCVPWREIQWCFFLWSSVWGGSRTWISHVRHRLYKKAVWRGTSFGAFSKRGPPDGDAPASWVGIWEMMNGLCPAQDLRASWRYRCSLRQALLFCRAWQCPCLCELTWRTIHHGF